MLCSLDDHERRTYKIHGLDPKLTGVEESWVVKETLAQSIDRPQEVCQSPLIP